MARQALGRFRGGLTTKLHLACDGRGLPLAVVVTPGNINDSTVFDTVMGSLRVPRTGTGRPRRRPEAVIADEAYSSRAIRRVLRRRGVRAVIPERADQQANRLRRGQAGGRPPAFDRELDKARNVVERCSGRLKQFRAIATRFDELATRYKAGVHLAALVLWLREPTQDPLSDRTWRFGAAASPLWGGRCSLRPVPLMLVFRYEARSMLRRSGYPTGLNDAFAYDGRIFEILALREPVSDDCYRRVIGSRARW
ncbi:hypothetical protein GCM10010275_71400 [Streptomyces litmocidini]|nr:hypothetical protein GCM10010275_71400 [Streptomyces litmocidini]